MIKVIEIKETSNPEILSVVFEQVLSAFDLARGFRKAKKARMTASAEKHSFNVGDEFSDRQIVTIAYDKPLYDGHEAFETNGKFYQGYVLPIGTTAVEIEAIKQRELSKLDKATVSAKALNA